MRNVVEWVIRHVGWRLPSQRTRWDEIFRGAAVVHVLRHERPRINGTVLDDWLLQTISMCPAGGQLFVDVTSSAIKLTVVHPKYIEQGRRNLVEIRVDKAGNPYLYFDLILFKGKDYPGFGAVAFYRAAQAAKRVGFQRIELLAAGGAGYKHQWTRQFNGFHSWARYGFNAPLWPKTLQLLKGHPKLSNCRDLLDVINTDPEWWKQNGDGCDLTFDLRSGSRSWYTLAQYLKERGLQ